MLKIDNLLILLIYIYNDVKLKVEDIYFIMYGIIVLKLYS